MKLFVSANITKNRYGMYFFITVFIVEPLFKYVKTLHQRLILGSLIIWNMTTCKLTICRLNRETYLSRTENHILALMSPTNAKISEGSAQKRVVRVSGYKQLFMPYCTYQRVSHKNSVL